MREKQATWLGWLTLIALLAAIWVLFGEDPGRNQAGRGEKLYPGLSDQVADITDITISAAETKVTLSYDGTIWRVEERSGFAADRARIADLVGGLVRSTRRDPKTTRESRFAAIGLGDQATVISLSGAGPDIPDLDIGTRNEGASGRSLTFVFKAGDTRAWLVSDIPDISADPADWVAKQVALLTRDQIATIAFSGVTLARNTEGALIVDGLTDGETMTGQYLRTDVTRLFSDLRIEDVRQIANPLAEPEATVTATDADGRAVTMTLYTLEDAPFVQLNVAGGDTADLTARTSGWMYRISSGDAAILRRTRTDFVTPPPAAEGVDTSGS